MGPCIMSKPSCHLPAVLCRVPAGQRVRCLASARHSCVQRQLPASSCGFVHSRCSRGRCLPLRTAVRRSALPDGPDCDELDFATTQARTERPCPDGAEEPPEASTSGRDADDELDWPSDEQLDARMAESGSGGGAGVAAAAIFGVQDVKRLYHKLEDRIFYDDILPPTGSQQISYARLLQLLSQRLVKRITLLADGKVAIVEIPVEGFASNQMTMKYDRHNPNIMYMEENPEWMMEKYRFLCELPGDMWEDGYFMNLVHMAQPHRTEDGRVPYDRMLRVGQVHCELTVVDPSSQSAWLNQYGRQFIPIFALLLLRGVVGIGAWITSKFTKKKDPMQELADELGAHRAKEYNVGQRPNEIGVKYDDVAGIDAIKDDIKVAMDMLLGAPSFAAMGARPYRHVDLYFRGDLHKEKNLMEMYLSVGGVLLEGPPGTGKTYLAKAMASEAGVPFFSANGAEFVEMFQGVASARIRSLFTAARKVSPAIIFIDEIDAIGKARGSSGDSGSAEREQGLLQLLTEMDGFKREDKVLVVGATNRATALDDALLRPGRFDRQIYMGRPTLTNRFRILQVHAKNKPISRAGNEEHEEDALLHKVAELAIGYSGAELANLLNESAILAVRRNQAEIDLPVVVEAMEKITLGLRQAPLPASDAKDRMAQLAAARVVLLSLTPGLPPVQHVTILPRGGIQGRVLFTPLEEGASASQAHKLFYGAKGSGGRTPSTFDFCARLLVPLYAARAAEEVLFGRGGQTLSTAAEAVSAVEAAQQLMRKPGASIIKTPVTDTCTTPSFLRLGSSGQVASARELAQWLVRRSTLHPAMRATPMLYSMDMGGWPDPTTQGLEPSFEPLALQLLRATYDFALAQVRSRLPVIQQVAQELLSDREEQVSGERIRQLLAEAAQQADGQEPSMSQLLAQHQAMPASWAGEAGFRAGGGGASGEASFHQQPPEFVADSDSLRKAAEVIVGRQDLSELTGPQAGRSKADLVKEQMARLEERERAVEECYQSSDGARFPPPPDLPDATDSDHWEQVMLDGWVQEKRVIEIRG